MKKLFFCFVFLIVSFQLISAIDTNIHIKTVPLKNVNLVIPTNDPPYISNKDANEYGDVFFVFHSDDSKFDLTIFVKDIISGNKVASKILKDQVTGEDLYLEVVPDGFNIIETPSNNTANSNLTENLTNSSIQGNSNLTQDNLSLGTEQKNKHNFTLSGLFVFENKSKSEKIIFYIVIGVVLLLIILFIIFKLYKRRASAGLYGKKPSNNIHVKKFSEWKEERREKYPQDYEKIVRDAQRTVDEAQRELSQIRNKDKILEAERKVQQDREELRRLRGR
jgi:hypothetical protein